LQLLGLLPLALGLAACGGGTSSSTPAKPATTAEASATQALTIKVTSVVTKTRSRDTPPKGTSRGDKVEQSGVLLNGAAQFGKQLNARVGTDSATTTVTATSMTMNGVAKLPDGTIIFKGEVTVLPDKTVSVPVTGGTGKYADASGTLVVGMGASQALNTYRLIVAADIPGPIA
jgi:hypothetical protein